MNGEDCYINKHQSKKRRVAGRIPEKKYRESKKIVVFLLLPKVTVSKQTAFHQKQTKQNKKLLCCATSIMLSRDNEGEEKDLTVFCCKIIQSPITSHPPIVFSKFS